MWGVLSLRFLACAGLYALMVSMPPCCARMAPQAGASPHVIDGTTAKCLPIHVAVMSDRAAVIEALLQAGADPNAEDATGASPFWLAASYNALESLPLLARAGADAFALNSKEQSDPEQVARTHGYSQAAELVRRLQMRQRMLEKQQRRKGGGGDTLGGDAAAAAGDAELQQRRAEADKVMEQLLQELETSTVSEAKGSSGGTGKTLSKAAAKRRQRRRAAVSNDNGSNSAQHSGSGDRTTMTSVLQPLSAESSSASIDAASPLIARDGSSMITSLATLLPQSPGIMAMGASSRKQDAAEEGDKQQQRRQQQPKSAKAAVAEQQQQQHQQQPAPAPPPPPDPLAELRAEWDELVGQLAAERDAMQREELAAEVRQRMEDVAAAGVSVKHAKKVLGKLDKAARALATLQAVMGTERLDAQALEEAVAAARPLRALLPEGALDAPEAELAAWQAQRDSLPADLFDVPSPPRPLRQLHLEPDSAGLQPPHQQQQQHLDEHGLALEDECVVCLSARRSGASAWPVQPAPACPVTGSKQLDQLCNVEETLLTSTLFPFCSHSPVRALRPCLRLPGLHASSGAAPAVPAVPSATRGALAGLLLSFLAAALGAALEHYTCSCFLPGCER